MSKRALLAMLGALAIALDRRRRRQRQAVRRPLDGFANQLASARLATAKYATDLDAAKADGYQIITRDIPNMGWHFMNPKIQDFDVRRPPILVYEKTSPTTWQLAALEWVFPKRPAKPPFPSARYGSFPAACHYADGTFVPQASQDRCAKTAPGHRRRLHLLAPGPRHAARVAVVPEPQRVLRQLQPARQAVQRG